MVFIGSYFFSFSVANTQIENNNLLVKKLDVRLHQFYSKIEKKYLSLDERIKFLTSLNKKIDNLLIKYYNSKILVFILNYIKQKNYSQIIKYKQQKNMGDCLNMTDTDENILNKLIIWHGYDSKFNIIRKKLSKQELCLNVVKLDLSKLWLKFLPKQIGYLRNLKTLNLYSNNLTELPKEIWNLNNLKYLYLNSNNLTSLPETIGKLHNLVEINLTDNNLVSLPESIGDLDNLEFLELGYNKLTLLPSTIWNLKNLKELYLNDNNLIKLPNSITHLNKLQYLSLSWNEKLWKLNRNFTLHLSEKICEKWVLYSGDLCIEKGNNTLILKNY